MENIRKQIVEIVKRSQRILLMPSTPVDGDSLGSSLALYLVFKKMGKEVTVVCADPVPEAFKFLPTTKVIGSEFSPANDFIVTLDCRKAKINTIRTKLEQDKVNIIITAKKGQFSKEDVSFHHGPSKYDLIITVDTGDLSQLGRFYEDNTAMFSGVPLINIDHHASNSHFGRINYVDIMASATTEMLIRLIQDFEKEEDKKLMDEDIATLLLAGIITDTGSFQNANTTPRSFAASAILIKYGARQQEIIQNVFKTKNLSTLKLWGRILSKIKVDKEHHIVWSTVNRRDLQETHSTADETGGIIDELLSNAPDSEIVLLIKEKEDGIISGSVRTINSSIDASAVAEMFGGGGHTQAAGFKIRSEDLEKTEKMIIEKVREFQEKRHKAASTFDYDEEGESSVTVDKATEIDMGEEVTERTVEKKPRISGETKKEKKMKKTAATEKTPEEEKET
ncbi:bifunctional oligoribonuclease/PAP phosphatase NrnA, partial [Patescibacteria group bacterium]|nr:bifunctional oligoribonuclease/PAP phosphatase NrnA [Patescibacteria group bacterium]MBU1703340.1 bifunctional oligoribonuclease/PAP phosphatase NrnA [Patescibacteria group bacterium]MBU1954409.1 bifunctional oligoribonuclease/PAP phosphatase NrnA [Patescibacteria group bacterium]